MAIKSKYNKYFDFYTKKNKISCRQTDCSYLYIANCTRYPATALKSYYALMALTLNKNFV